MDAMRPDESDASSARIPPACRLPAAGARSPWRPVATCLLAMLMVILAGCASTGPKSTAADDSIARQMVEPTLAQPPAPDTGPINLNQEQGQPDAPIKPEIEVGTGKFFDEKVARSPTHGGEAPKGKVTFNFENQPIQAVVKAILGDLLEKNYIIAPGVNGNVSYSTAQPVRTEDAMPILETLLGWTNNTLIFKDGRYTVLPIKQAIPGNLTPRLAPAQVAKGYEVRIFPLHYISPSEMQKLLKPFAPADAFVSVDTSRSLLILAGTPSELINYQRTINTFDVDWLKGMSVGVYNMQNQDVGKLMPQLDEIFGSKGESPLAGMFRFVPIEATNSVIVITPQPEYLDKARDWLARLDAGAGGGEAGQQLYIYNVINMKAVDLADYLNQIFNGSAPRPSSDTGGSVAPGLTSIEVGGNRNGSNSNNNRRQQRRSTPTRSAAVVNPKDGGPRITAVEQNNQLLVLATATQWNTIQLAAKRLDIQPLQVQIEAKILEVQLTGNFSFGVQWYLEGLIGSEAEWGFRYRRSRPAWQSAGLVTGQLGGDSCPIGGYTSSIHSSTTTCRRPCMPWRAAATPRSCPRPRWWSPTTRRPTSRSATRSRWCRRSSSRAWAVSATTPTTARAAWAAPVSTAARSASARPAFSCRSRRASIRAAWCTWTSIRKSASPAPPPAPPATRPFRSAPSRPRSPCRAARRCCWAA